MISDVIIIVVIAVILGGALWYMKREKNKGVNCIGCPDADVCTKRRNGESCGTSNN